jgi:hypothetical protein
MDEAAQQALAAGGWQGLVVRKCETQRSVLNRDEVGAPLFYPAGAQRPSLALQK